MLRLGELQAQSAREVMSRNLPESSGFGGSHLIDLGIPADAFRADLPELTYALEIGGTGHAVTGGPTLLGLESMTASCWAQPVARSRAILLDRWKEDAETGRTPSGFGLWTDEHGFELLHGTRSVHHSRTLYEPGQWYHLAATSDGTTIRLFVNGVAEIELERPGALLGEGPLFIGNTSTVARGTIRLDDIRLWDHPRDAATLRDDMYRPLEGSEEGLLGAWKAGRGGPSVLEDLSPHGRNMTLKGAKLVPTRRPHIPPHPEPALFLIEKYRLSVFPGRVGQGRVLNTFTLLPGERTRISVSTFTKTEQQRKQASSILDSQTEESEHDFQNSLQTEQSSRTQAEQHMSAYAEVEGEQAWGFGKVKGKAGAKASADACREDFAKTSATPSPSTRPAPHASATSRSTPATRSARRAAPRPRPSAASRTSTSAARSASCSAR